MSQTATTYGARDHARAQAGTRAPAQPTIPACEATDLPPGVAPETVIWDETLGAGGYASHRLPRGARLCLVDLEGDACANLLAYNAESPTERLNVADTIKVQWQAYLGQGTLLLSDMGRVLLTMVEDTSGRHDALCGASTPASNRARYGDAADQESHPSARERFLLALAKHGLGRRDAAANVNLFKGVRVEGDGALRWVDGPSQPGAHVTLRAEMDVLVVLANTPHRLDPRAEYRGTRLRATAWQGPSTSPDDSFRTATPETLRAFQNTEDWLLGRKERR